MYVDHTTTTIKERMRQHTSIKEHYKDTQNMNYTGTQMMLNVTILVRFTSKNILSIAEALHIKQMKPAIKIQCGDFNRALNIFKEIYYQPLLWT